MYDTEHSLIALIGRGEKSLFDFFVDHIGLVLLLIWISVAGRAIPVNDSHQVNPLMFWVTLLGTLIPLGYAIDVPMDKPNPLNIALGSIVFVCLLVLWSWLRAAYVDMRTWKVPSHKITVLKKPLKRSLKRKAALTSLLVIAGCGFLLVTFAQS